MNYQKFGAKLQGRCRERRKLETLRRPAMASTQQLRLPTEKFRLEEINMPEELASDLAGRTVAVKVLPEMPSRTLRI